MFTKSEADAGREYSWYKRFCLTPHRMPDGKWIWLRSIEVRTDYFDPLMEHRRYC